MIRKFKNCISLTVNHVNLKFFKTGKVVLSCYKCLTDAIGSLKDVNYAEKLFLEKFFVIPIMTFKLDLKKFLEHIKKQQIMKLYSILIRYL